MHDQGEKGHKGQFIAVCAPVGPDLRHVVLVHRPGSDIAAIADLFYDLRIVDRALALA